jgi:hypothetical protein
MPEDGPPNIGVPLQLRSGVGGAGLGEGFVGAVAEGLGFTLSAGAPVVGFACDDIDG